MTEAQTKLRELLDKQSRDRQRALELSKGDTLTDEARTELADIETRAADLEPQIRAARGAVADEQAADPKDLGDPETRERLELRSRVTIGSYMQAAIDGRGVDGAEAEFNQLVGLRAAGAFPLELLAPPVEVRATTDTDSQTTQGRWIDRLFADTAAAYLGVTMESVAPGVASFPVTTAGAAAAQRGRTEAAANAAWTVGVKELKPKRNAVRAVFSEEDAMRLPSLEESLRRDLGMALTEGVDRVIFVGDDGANEAAGDIAGLTTAANVVEQTVTQTNKVKPAETLAAFLAFIDGKHASMVEDLNCVLSVGAHNLWAGAIANSAAENQTLLAFLKANGLTCMTRGEIEAATGNGKFGAFVGRGRGIAGAAVAAIWESATLIRDPYSGAASGEVALTLSHFWDFALPRPSNFGRIKFVT